MLSYKIANNIMNNLPKRKSTRLKDYDYSSNGAYFITICTKDMKCILSKITVGGADPDDSEAQVCLSKYGIIVKNEIEKMNEVYDYINVEKYVIMPNHVHLIIEINKDKLNGSSGAPTPTNSVISKYVGTLKRFCNKQYGENVWQRGSNDRVIRNEKEYQNIWQYIEENPKKWLMGKDEYYA